MMRKTILTALAAIAFSFTAFAQKDTLRVLAIGNSFSEDAVEQNLANIAAADGRVIIVGNLYIGGCSLQTHWENASADKKAYRYRRIGADLKMVTINNVAISAALKDQPWDVVSLQQRSGFSANYYTYEPFVSNLKEYVQANTEKDVKFVFHQTWAYEGSSMHQDFTLYNRDQMKMYKGILDASSKTVKKHGFTVIPCGTAVQNLRTSYVGDHITRDGFHMNKVFGRYLLAATWYEVLTGSPVQGNTYCPKGMDERMLETTQAAAHLAILKPFKVTDMSKKGFGKESK